MDRLCEAGEPMFGNNIEDYDYETFSTESASFDCGREKSVFTDILSSRNLSHLRKVFCTYKEKTGIDIAHIIGHEVPVDVKKFVRMIVNCISEDSINVIEHALKDGEHLKDSLTYAILYAASRSELNLEEIVCVARERGFTVGEWIKDTFPYDDNLCYLLLLLCKVPNSLDIV